VEKRQQREGAVLRTYLLRLVRAGAEKEQGLRGGAASQETQEEGH
jgi:hypothetical protein